MPRAKETAKIVSRSVNLKPQEMDFFCESLLPVEKKQMVRFKNSKSSKQELNKLVRRMGQNQKVAKAAFKLLFAKPVRGNKTIGVVAHGNVIRFWLCLALNISGKKWLDFDLTQCSITTIRIDKSGNIMVLGFADCGHLKKSQQTYI